MPHPSQDGSTLLEVKGESWQPGVDGVSCAYACVLGVLSINALLRTGQNAGLWAGLWAGLSIVAHSGSVFFFPLWMFILFTRPGENRSRML